MLRQLPLHGLHAALGASFRSVGDWELPSHYAGVGPEYAAARDQAALADVGFWGKFVFRGPDRGQFLHGLLTNDVKGLEPGRGAPACLLTPKGKLVANFFLYNPGEEFLAVLPPQASPQVSGALAKYLPLSDTVLEDLSESLGALFLTGPKAGGVLQAVIPHSPLLPSPACRTVEWRGSVVRLLSYPGFGVDGFLILIPGGEAGNLWNELLRVGHPQGLRPMGHGALEVLRVEAGIPLFSVDVDEEVYPMEALLEDAVSYTKGCYLGQETIARLKYKGRPRHQLIGLRLADRPEPGDDVLLEGKPVGRVTSVVDSPRLNAVLAMAMVPSDHGAAGGRLKVHIHGREREAEVVPFPAR